MTLWPSLEIDQERHLQTCPLTLVLKTYLKVVLASGLMEMEMSSSRDVRLKEAGDYLCLEIA